MQFAYSGPQQTQYQPQQGQIYNPQQYMTPNYTAVSKQNQYLPQSYPQQQYQPNVTAKDNNLIGDRSKYLDIALEEKERMLRDLGQNLEAREKISNELNYDLEDKKRKLKHIESILEDKGKTVRDLELIADKRDTSQNYQDPDQEQRDRKLIDLESDFQDRYNDFQQSRSQLQNENIYLTENIKNHHEQYVEIQQLMGQLQNKCMHFKQQNEQKTWQCLSLQLKLNELGSQKQILQAQADQMKNGLSAGPILRHQLVKKDSEIQVLEDRVRDMENNLKQYKADQQANI